MNELSPGRFTPADDGKSRGGRRKPSLKIDFEADVDPLLGVGTGEAEGLAAEGLEPPARTLGGAAATGGVGPDPAPEAATGEPAGDGATRPGGDSRPAEARVRRTPRPGPDPEEAARLLGVPAPLARIEVTVSVEVGRRRMSLAELVSSEPGALVPLDRLTDEPVDILVNGKPFGRGEIVAIGEKFGVRLLDLADGTD